MHATKEQLELKHRQVQALEKIATELARIRHTLETTATRTLDASRASPLQVNGSRRHAE